MSSVMESIKKSMPLQGATSEMALKLMGAFMNQQTKYLDDSPSGAVVEFGTFKGRVSLFLGLEKRPTDELVLVDVADYLERDVLEGYGLQYRFNKMCSEDWVEQNTQPIIVSHHDASHYFENVKSELNGIADYVDKSSLVILDDFADPFNQVRAAYYYTRYVDKLPLELLLIGFGKGILVHQDAFSDWEAFVVESLQDKLREFDLDSMLYRTDDSKFSRAFSITKKANAEQPDRYGTNIYGDRFYQAT